MCDCFNQIFGVTWSPASTYGAEEETSARHDSNKAHASSAAKVKEKFSPLKPVFPPGSHPHLSPEEARDADQAAQKEKLHAELKKVLQLKVQRDSSPQTEAQMETRINITEEKLVASEMVEVIVETEAQAGMSGFTLSGGGKEGLFITEVLKDSPAAKALTLQEGDQLLSARVYFENVKYEDALQILECAEQYKVSYCLKRTVQYADVTVSPSSRSVEVKGPKAKMPKMTVKSLTPVKKKKKVPSQPKVSGESSMEAMKGSELSAGSMEIPQVDVEFSFPKFSKFRKTKGATETGAEIKSPKDTTKLSAVEQKRTKLTFPRLRVKEAAAAGSLSVEVPESKVGAALPESSADIKEKDRATAKFGISVPKMKKSKGDVTLSNVESEAKEERSFKAPQVELDITLPTMKADTPEISSKESGKMGKFGASAKIPDVEIKVPTSHIEVEGPEIKLSMPHISKVGICLPKLEKESEIAVEVQGKPKTEIKLPSVEVAAPKFDIDLSLPKFEGGVEAKIAGDKQPETSGKGFQIKGPKFGISAKAPDADLEVCLPQVKKDIEVEVSEDKFKMPSIKVPKIGISPPKGKADGEMSVSVPRTKLEADSPDGKQKTIMKLPSLDVSAPKVDFDMMLSKEKLVSKISGDMVSESTEIPDVALKMPKISLPKFITKGGIQEPQAEVKIRKIQTESPDIKLKGPKMKLPSFGISLSKEKIDTSLPEMDASGKVSRIGIDGKQKFPSITIPSLDISLPKVQDIQPGKLESSGPTIKAEIKGPELESTEGHDFKLKMPKVSLPKFDMSTKAEKPQMSPPKIGIHIPKLDAKIKDGDLETKGDKMTLPKLDVSVPKIKQVELGLSSPKTELEISVDKPKVGVKVPKVGSGAKGFDVEIGDSKLGLPSVKIPHLDIDIPKLDIDLNLPKVKAHVSEPHIEESNRKLQMPNITFPKLGDIANDMAIEIDVPKIKADLISPHIEANIKGPDSEGMDKGDNGGKISLPKIGIGLGKSAMEHDVEITEGELKTKPDVKFPKVRKEVPDVDAGDTEAKIKLPSVKLPSVAITMPKMPDVDIDASMPKVALEVSGSEDVAGVSSDSDVKWKAPKFSLRKFGISGPKIKKGEAELKALQREGELDTAVKGPKMKMPKFGISFPKAKHEVDVDISKPTLDLKTSKGKKDVSGAHVDASSEGKVTLPSVKLPSVDISAPKLEVDIGLPKGQSKASPVTDKPSDISIDIPDVKLNLPKFALPKFGSQSKGSDMEVEMESPKVGGKVTPPKSDKGIEASSGKRDVGGADVKLKGKEAKMKMPAFKMPSFGMSKKEAYVSEERLEAGFSPPEVKIKKAKAPVKESKLEVETQESNGKTSFIKMPTFKMSAPKVKAPEVDLAIKSSKEDLFTDVHVKVPQIALPSFGIKEGIGDRAADITLPKADAKVTRGIEGPHIHISEKIKMPALEISAPQEVSSLQISVPCVKPEVNISSPKAEVDVSDADIKGYEGDLKIPKLPSIDVFAPSLELGISLPKAKLDTSLEHKADRTPEKSEMKIKMPKVELPKFGETDVKLDVEGAKYRTSEAETKLKGSKIKMPHFDISLPKVRSDDEDIPFIEGEMKMHGSDLETSGTEGTFSLPSVGLPKMSTPKIKAPELELDISLSKDKDYLNAEDLSKTHKAEVSSPEVGLPDFKIKMPKMKLPKFGGFRSGSDEETTKVGVKTLPTEEGGDSGIMGFKIKMPKLQVGSLKEKGREDISVGVEGDHKVTTKGDMKATDLEAYNHSGKFNIKMPFYGISKGSADGGTEPLHPSREGTEIHFKMPKMSIPHVGFSGSEGEGQGSNLNSGGTQGDFRSDAKIKGPNLEALKSSSIEDLEIDLGLKMPKIKMPTIGMAGWKVDDDMTMSLEEDSDAKKSLFKMPDVEISTPKIKALPEYDVDGIKLEHSLSRETEIEGPSTKKSGKDYGATGEDSGKKYRMKLPKFGISLPKAVTGDVEISAPKLKTEVKESELSMKTLSAEHDTDKPEGKGKMLKVKKAGFVLGKPKDKSTGLLESDVDATLESEGPEVKLKMPKIKMKPSFGLSRGKAKGTDVNGEFDAASTDTEMPSPDGTTRSSKIKFPRLGFSSKTGTGDDNVNGTSTSDSPFQLNGENEVSVQNGSQDGRMKIGKLKLPKVEFSSPYKAKELDSEMNLKLVKSEEPDSKEEGNGGSFAAKFKSPKITFSGFKKKDKSEESEAPKHLVSSPARTEMSTMENVVEGEAKTGRAKISLGFLSSKSKGEYTVDNSGLQMETRQKDAQGEGGKEKSAKYKLPKLSLSPKSVTELEIATETHEIVDEGSQEGFKISMPNVGFTTHHEEHTTEEHDGAGGFLKITKTKQSKTETVTEKTVAI
ncbi:periaxin isoform X1 [Ascaphus truei]|uniref:periaxin isoform X1 n=2 Tax=Ascaphus truei TaxID=8439 RepID=UPI003F5AD71A